MVPPPVSFSHLWFHPCNIPFSPTGAEKELSVHDGTIRDVAFLTNEHLLSGGAGDCSICLSDVATGTMIETSAPLSSHNGNNPHSHWSLCSTIFIIGQF